MAVPVRLVRAAVAGVAMAMAAALLPMAVAPLGARAQEAPEPAAVVADEYLRGIEALAWRATAQRLHPDALADLRAFLRIQVEHDRSGELLDALSDGGSPEAYFDRDGRSLFVSVMRALTDRTPGIINAMSARTTEVLGPVAEGDSLRHVVYRLQWRISGSTPEIQVLTLAPDSRNRWRVLRAPELQSIRPAIRGLRSAQPPPGSPSPEPSPAGGTVP